MQTEESVIRTWCWVGFACFTAAGLALLSHISVTFMVSSSHGNRSPRSFDNHLVAFGCMATFTTAYLSLATGAEIGPQQPGLPNVMWAHYLALAATHPVLLWCLTSLVHNSCRLTFAQTFLFETSLACTLMADTQRWPHSLGWWAASLPSLVILCYLLLNPIKSASRIRSPPLHQMFEILAFLLICSLCISSTLWLIGPSGFQIFSAVRRMQANLLLDMFTKIVFFLVRLRAEEPSKGGHLIPMHRCINLVSVESPQQQQETEFSALGGSADRYHIRAHASMREQATSTSGDSQELLDVVVRRICAEASWTHRQRLVERAVQLVQKMNGSKSELEFSPPWLLLHEMEAAVQKETDTEAAADMHGRMLHYKALLWHQGIASEGFIVPQRGLLSVRAQS